MRSLLFSLSLAAVASAQYAITDLIGHDKDDFKGPSATPPMTASPPLEKTGPSKDMHPVGPVPGSAAASAMASILSGKGVPSRGPFSGGALSEESMTVVSGMVEAFMHKVKLEPGERECLENNVRTVSGDVMGTVGDVVTAVKALMAGGKGDDKKNAAGSLISAGIDSAMKITSLVTSSMALIKNCVHGDALEFLNMTAHHLINGTYLEDRFIVNGVDIAHSLSDTIMAYESKDFHRFGADIGLALRKILLSNSQNATRLPEGMPEQVIIQEATDGLMQGFFVEGSAIEITDKAHPDVDIPIDLHQCIAGNSAFFKELWLAAWNLIAKLSMNGQEHGFASEPQQKPDEYRQPKWEGELMVALMQFPTALANCGVSPDVQTMLTEAVQSLGDIRVKTQFPREKFDGDAVADEMAKAVEAWTNWNFKGFGFALGNLLRELVMLAFPQKYAVDASGKLQRYTQTLMEAKKVHKRSGLSSFMMVTGGAAASVLFAFAVVRPFRSLSHTTATFDRMALASDVEDGMPEVASNNVLVE